MTLPLATAAVPTAVPTTAGNLVQSFSAAAFDRLRASVTGVNNVSMATIAPGTGPQHSYPMSAGDIFMEVVVVISSALFLGMGCVMAYRCVSARLSARRDFSTRDPMDATATQRPDVAVPVEPPPSYTQATAAEPPPSYAQATAAELPPSYV